MNRSEIMRFTPLVMNSALLFVTALYVRRYWFIDNTAPLDGWTLPWIIAILGALMFYQKFSWNGKKLLKRTTFLLITISIIFFLITAVAYGASISM